MQTLEDIWESALPRCDLAPKNWYCSRTIGHDGPCAARPLKNHLYDVATARWGVTAQAQVAVEELAELQKEICKFFFRGKNLTECGLIEELADAEIMIEQIKRIACVNEAVEKAKQLKLDRLAGRVFT